MATKTKSRTKGKRPTSRRKSQPRRRKDQPIEQQQARVEEASEESLPASDAPSFTGGVPSDLTKPIERPGEPERGFEPRVEEERASAEGQVDERGDNSGAV
jgi:hypothetical protein